MLKVTLKHLLKLLKKSLIMILASSLLINTAFAKQRLQPIKFSPLKGLESLSHQLKTAQAFFNKIISLVPENQALYFKQFEKEVAQIKNFKIQKVDDESLLVSIDQQNYTFTIVNLAKGHFLLDGQPVQIQSRLLPEKNLENLKKALKNENVFFSLILPKSYAGNPLGIAAIGSIIFLILEFAAPAIVAAICGLSFEASSSENSESSYLLKAKDTAAAMNYCATRWSQNLKDTEPICHIETSSLELPLQGGGSIELVKVNGKNIRVTMPQKNEDSPVKAVEFLAGDTKYFLHMKDLSIVPTQIESSILFIDQPVRFVSEFKESIDQLNGLFVKAYDCCQKKVPACDMYKRSLRQYSGSKPTQLTEQTKAVPNIIKSRKLKPGQYQESELK